MNPLRGICWFGFKVWGQDFDGKGFNFEVDGCPSILPGSFLA